MSIITSIRCDNCGCVRELEAASYRSDIGFTVFGMNPDGSSRHLCSACYANKLGELLKNVIALAKS